MTILPDVIEVYDRFLALMSVAKREFSGELAGKLLLVPGLEAESHQLVFAAGIAAAVSLVVEPDRHRAHEANRLRVCEFTVNALDEAVRILKNQLRKRQPVAVLLNRALAESLGEMLERGLQPDLALVATDSPCAELVGRFVARGATPVGLERQQGSGMLDVSWKTQDAPGFWLPKLDALFSSLFPGDARNRWVLSAPLYLDRALQFRRFVRLNRVEASLFVAAVKDGVASGKIGVPVLVKVGEGEEETIAVRKVVRE